MHTTTVDEDITSTFVTLNVATTHGPVPFIGELTTTPGVLVTPDFGGGHQFTGDWDVTHAASGLLLGRSVTLLYARESALLLGDHNVDWTRDSDQLADDTTARAAVSALCVAVSAAKQHVQPVVWDDTPADVGTVRCGAPFCDPDRPEDAEQIAAQIALAQGWTQREHRWLCEWCSDLYATFV